MYLRSFLLLPTQKPRQQKTARATQGQSKQKDNFRGTETLSDPGNTRNSLYCLLPVRVGTNVIIAEISRSALVNTVINGTWSEQVLHFMKDLTQVKQEWQDQMMMTRRMHASVFFSKINRLTRFGRSRRF